MKNKIGLWVLSFLFLTSARAEVIEKIVAVVNDNIITLSDMSSYKVRLKEGKLVDDLLLGDTSTKSDVLKSDEKLLQLMINERIVDREVKKQGLSVTFERVEQEIRTISNKNHLARGQLKEALQQQGISFDAYQDFIKTRLERQALIEKYVTSKIKISDDDLRSYLNSKKNKLSGDTIFEYTVAQILFLKAKDSKAKALHRAELVYDKLKEGGTFEDLASKYSEDPNFSSGGQLGTFKESELIKDFISPIKKLNVGEYSKVVETPTAFHLIKLLAKQQILDPKMEEEKDKIRSDLYQLAFKKQFQFWLDQRRRESFIRINS